MSMWCETTERPERMCAALWLWWNGRYRKEWGYPNMLRFTFGSLDADGRRRLEFHSNADAANRTAFRTMLLEARYICCTTDRFGDMVPPHTTRTATAVFFPDGLPEKDAHFEHANVAAPTHTPAPVVPLADAQRDMRDDLLAMGIKPRPAFDMSAQVTLRCIRCGLNDAWVIASPCECLTLCRSCFANVYATSALKRHCPACLEPVRIYRSVEDDVEHADNAAPTHRPAYTAPLDDMPRDTLRHDLLAIGIKPRPAFDTSAQFTMRCIRCGLNDADVVAAPCDCLALCRACFANVYATSAMARYCPACLEPVHTYRAMEDDVPLMYVDQLNSEKV